MTTTIADGHTWTEYPNGTAHCPRCGSVRQSNGEVRSGTIHPPCDALAAMRRVVDGVIIEGPLS